MSSLVSCGQIVGLIISLILIVGVIVSVVIGLKKKRSEQKEKKEFKKNTEIVTNNKICEYKEDAETKDLCDQAAFELKNGNVDSAYELYYKAHLAGSARGSFFAGELKSREEPYTSETLDAQIELLREAEKRGFPYAAGTLTATLVFGEDEGTERYTEGMKYFRTLEDRDDPESYALLGNVYLDITPIKGIAPDEQKGVKYLEKYVSFADSIPYIEDPTEPRDIEDDLILGYPKNIREGMYMLGRYYYSLDGKENEAKGLKYLLKCVEAPIKHKAEAYMLISDCYVSGFGTKRNLNKATEYYDLALAEGMEPDHEEARRIEDKIRNAVQRQNELMGLANESSRRDFDSDTFRDWLNR